MNYNGIRKNCIHQANQHYWTSGLPKECPGISGWNYAYRQRLISCIFRHHIIWEKEKARLLLIICKKNPIFESKVSPFKKYWTHF